MNREKLNRLEEIANKRANPPYILILRKDGRHYLIERGEVGRELTEEDLGAIKSSKVVIDEDDLKA